MEASRIVGCKESLIVYTIGSQMAESLSAPRTNRDLLPGNITFLLLELISLTG
jgi:hypothetical protein